MTIHLAPDGHVTGSLDSRKVARFLLPPEILALKAHAGEYPAELLAARRIAFLRQMEAMRNPLEQRLAAIDTALGELTDRETVNNLLEEKAEILIQLGKE